MRLPEDDVKAQFWGRIPVEKSVASDTIPAAANTFASVESHRPY